MFLHSPNADKQQFSNLLIGFALGNQFDHFALTDREVFKQQCIIATTLLDK